MAGLATAKAEITRGCDDPMAKVIVPNTVHHDAMKGTVVVAANPVGKCHTALGVGGRLAYVEGSRDVLDGVDAAWHYLVTRTRHVAAK